MSLPRTHAGVLSPIKITEAVDLEDPFASSNLHQNSKEWGFVAPAGNPTMPEFPTVPTHEPWTQSTKPQVSTQPSQAPNMSNGSRKRKDMDSAAEENGRDEASPFGDATKDGSASPARKKIRFDPAAAAAEGVRSVMEKGRALFDKARLDFLATPKRKVDKMRGAKSTVKKGVKKPTWK
jgi:hypothetical protein